MNKLLAVSVLALMLGLNGVASAGYQEPSSVRGGFTGPGLEVSTVAEAAKLGDDTPVVVVGHIEKSLGDEKYLFKDASSRLRSSRRGPPEQSPQPFRRCEDRQFFPQLSQLPPQLALTAMIDRKSTRLNSSHR